MTYWDRTKRTILPQESSKLVNLMASSEYNFIPLKPGLSRKSSLQQEFLLTMMRLRLGLLTDDLAFRF